MAIAIEIEINGAGSNAAWLKERLAAVLRLLKVRRAAWSITLVRDAAMKELHARTMNIPTTTDVLTFDLRDDVRKTREGADVELDTVICLDEARRQARELGHPPKHEVLLYAVHSLLHVQGYDDLLPRQAKRMHRREDELLVALGIGRVYGRSEAAGETGARKPARRKSAKV